MINSNYQVKVLKSSSLSLFLPLATVQVRSIRHLESADHTDHPPTLSLNGCTVNHSSTAAAPSGSLSGSAGSACTKHKHSQSKPIHPGQPTNGTLAEQQGLPPNYAANVVDCASCCDRIQCCSSSKGQLALEKKSSSSAPNHHHHHHSSKAAAPSHPDANNNSVNKGQPTGQALNVSSSSAAGQQQLASGKPAKSPSHHSSAGSSASKPQRNSSATSGSHQHHHTSSSGKPAGSQPADKAPTQQTPVPDPASVPNLEQLKQEQALLKQHQKQKHQKAPNPEHHTHHSSHHRHSHQSSSSSTHPHHHSTSHAHHSHHSHHSTPQSKSSARDSPDSGKHSVSNKEVIDSHSAATGQHCHKSSKMPLVKGKESKEKPAEAQFDRE